jgi:hypothetical protein
MKRVVGALVLVVAIAFGASNAYAAWVFSSGGAGSSTSRAVGPSTATNAAAVSSSSIHITWSAPAAPSVVPTQYVVRRTAPSSATVCTVSGSTFACDDSGLASNTTYTYTVEARVGTNWSSGQTAGFSATTNGVPTFTVAVPPTAQTAGVSFATVLTATTNGVTVDSTYTGTKTITFSGPGSSPSGAAPIYPATVNFVSGVGTATVTLVRAETVSVQATDGTRVGATSVTVAAGVGTRLGYTSSTPSCAAGSVIVGNGGTFTSFVSVFDTYGNPATASVAQIIALASAPSGTGTLTPTSLTVAAGSSQTSGSFSFKLPVGNPPDVTLTASSGALTSVQCIVKKN